MFDLGWTELLLIGIVALIVVGPRDLPVLFRTLGRMTGKARAMAREFTQAMNDAADESGMREMSDTMRSVADPKSFGTDALRDVVDWGPRKSDEDARVEARARLDKQRKAADEDKARNAARAAELSESAAEMEAEPPAPLAPDGPPKDTP